MPGALLLACSDPSPPRESTASTHERIVDGTPETMHPEVLIMQDDTLPGFRCTATLIAPNLVITARHCVGQPSSGTTLCEGDGTSNGADSLPSYAGDAPAAPMNFASAPGATPLAHGKAIYDDNASTTCAHDLALVELDTPITSIEPALLRATPVAMNDALVVMGFGWTDRNATIDATQLMKGNTVVLALGPSVFTFQPDGDATATPVPLAVAGGEIGVQGVTMAGDSGGPAFDSDGYLAAIVSRGFDDALYGPGTFTTIAAHLATIEQALDASGNAPTFGQDGGDVYTPPADAGLPEDDGGGATTVRADSGTSSEASGDSSSGCAVTSSRSSNGLFAFLALFAISLVTLRRASQGKKPRGGPTSGKRPDARNRAANERTRAI